MMEICRHKVQFCVVGGGLAGMCAAIAAARHGIRTLIMQERPVFGGNASSEIRMWVCGARNFNETGLIEEIRLENLYRNTFPNYSVWDSILFEKVRFQANLTSLLNCSCMDAVTEKDRIVSVKGWQSTTQSFHVVEADYFADCSGDSILAPLSGAEFRIGREEKTEFGESLAQDAPDRKTMGLSCILQARETDSPKKFIPPAWAEKYPDDSSFPAREHTLGDFQNFWYLEFGGDQDSIKDTETLRDDLLKAAFGLWDHIKNHGDHGAENWVLDWVGFLPGKRESRRCMGDYILSQKDVLSGGHFEDVVAYGGWPIDDHHPGGVRNFGPPNTNIILKEPYGIPARCLYSKNIGNLLFAGRNISTTHTALSSSRVMATCATLGEAVGVIVSQAVKQGNVSPRKVCKEHIGEIQKILMDDDCYLPGKVREIPLCCRKASLASDSGDAENLRSGVDRELAGNANSWPCRAGSFAQYDFGEETELHRVRIVFDSKLSRDHRNMVSNYPKNTIQYAPPETLVEKFHLEADGRIVYHCEENHQRLVRIPLSLRCRTLKLVIDAVRSGHCKIFAFEAE